MPPATNALAFTGPASADVSLASTNQSSTTLSAPDTQQQEQNVYSHIVPSFRRCRALVLDSSYRPIDVINWQRAICLDLFDKARRPHNGSQCHIGFPLLCSYLSHACWNSGSWLDQIRKPQYFCAFGVILDGRWVLHRYVIEAGLL